MINESLLASFGARCRQLRLATGMSQENFAHDVVDMDRTYYALIELGRRNVTISTAKRLADGYGVTMGELFDGVSGDAGSPREREEE